MENILRDLLVYLPIFIIAVSLHEYGHALVATYLGDPTPKNLGRLTVNPLAHLDIVGTLMMILVHFGWAKPVPVNPELFRKDINKDLGMAAVALAGPLTNLFLAYICLQLLIFFPYPGIDMFLSIAIWVNVMLFIFNIIPIPPLDGSRFLRLFLKDNLKEQYDNLENFGFIIIIVLIMLPFTSQFFHISIKWVINFLNIFTFGG